MAPPSPNKLEGKLVVIVGGTSGIGLAVAAACVEHGSNLVIASRSQEKIDNAIERLKASYPDMASRIRGHICDLSSDQIEANIRLLFDFATDAGKAQVDHVINTAGELPPPLALQETTVDDILAACKARVVGDVILAKVASRYLKSAYTSSYTMTGGVGIYKPRPGYSVRSGIGGAKDALARGFAIDMKPIRVNLVSPGAIQTEMFDEATKLWGEGAMDKITREVSLLGRIGRPEDVAETYLSLMKNHFATGSIVFVDGGALIL